MGLGQKIRRLFRLFLLFTVLLTVSVISAITTIRLTIHGHQESMPNLVGQRLETAERLAGSAGLDFKISDRVFSTQYPPDQIISQVPLPGTRIKEGQTVHVLLSLGPPRQTVPNLIGASVRVAQIDSVQRGLSIGDIATVHSSDIDANQIVAQDPPPTSVEVHSPSVNLLVSLGGVPAAYVCPNFVGRQVGEVTNTLEKAGFKVAQVSVFAPEPVPGPASAAPGGTGQPPVSTVPPPSPPPSPGSVIVKQTPAAGSKISPGASFDFVVEP